MRSLRVFAWFVSCLALVAGSPAVAAPVWEAHITQAAQLGDPMSTRAARFLADHAPDRDSRIDLVLLNENLQLALRARAEFAWAREVPEDMFLNDVLPYASLDERREQWRPALYAISKQIVKDATTAEDAVQRLNDELFDIIGVHYNTGRKRANQAPFESMMQGRATCTGLSIILVNACRSVGIPARIVGVADWVSTPGNHTWVEIWDGDRWRFTGADEYDADGLDRGWFTGRAAEAVAGSSEHAVWATSWRSTDTHFPMAWSSDDTSVPAVDVTARYTPAAAEAATTDQQVTRFFRLWDTENGERIAATLAIQGQDARLRTSAGRADLNDMPSVLLTPGGDVIIDVRSDDVAFRTRVTIDDDPAEVVDLYLDELAITRDSAQDLARELVGALRDVVKRDRAGEIANEAITIGNHTLRYAVREYGDATRASRPLWISLHGGGGTTAEVNDQQWQNQIRLYRPPEGVYVAPRAPTDTWNLWHQAHIDALFGRLIENMIVFKNVDPDRVYLMGYSAGGDGVYQLAPRMADRFAAAAMMAGHPNESQPLGLRNLPFAIFMGGEDAAYDRNTVAQEWGDELEALRERDPEGYPHRVTIYPGLGHWMDGRDAEVLPWMLEQERRVWPKRVVWHQDDVLHDRFYWLSVRPGDARQGHRVTAEVVGQTIAIETTEGKSPPRIMLRLSDALVDLDQPIRVTVDGAPEFEGRVFRTRGAIDTSLSDRLDPVAVATGMIVIELR
ncbi:MAG: transglutaminase domain-containing protein [Phycisphaerales bacterium]